MRVYITEFWDCHYELLDSYLTSLGNGNKDYEVSIFALNPKLCESQVLLLTKYDNVKVNIFALEEISNAKKKPELCILNTSHMHGNQQSLIYSLQVIEALESNTTVVICHNTNDVKYAEILNTKNKKCFFLAEDCNNYYFSKGLLNNLESFVYDAYADYKYMLRPKVRNDSSPIDLAITGMIREGKKIHELERFAPLIEKNKIKIHVYGSAQKNILRDSGFYKATKDGYIDTSIVTNKRIEQRKFLHQVSKCDALLDLKIKTSKQSRGSTSGNLQLSRSLEIPLITHVSSHPNFQTINFLDYDHLEFILSSKEVFTVLYNDTKRILEMNRKENFQTAKLV